MRKRSLRLAALLVALPIALAPPVLAAPAGENGTSDTDGHAVGQAGAALSLARVLPGTVPEDSIVSDLDEELDLATDNGLGFTSARADSTSAAAFERAMAQATPHGAATAGSSSIPRPVPGTLIQTALEDNAEPASGDIEQGDPPPAALTQAGALDGTVHARWSEETGPCVEPIARADSSTADLAVGNAVLTLPDVPLDDLDLPLHDGFDPDGTLGTLGGLLAGIDPPQETDGSLVSLPEGLSSRSSVTLTGTDGDGAEAVQATSTLEAPAISVLEGSPMGLDIDLAAEPALTVTSTGQEDTSEVDYRTPELEATLGGETIFELDAEQQSADLPIGVPTDGFENVSGSDEIGGQPIVGGVAATADDELLVLPDEADEHILDLFVLRLSIAGLDEQATSDHLPYPGHHLTASARLLDVQLLPTEALADALEAIDTQPPSALAQFTIGEQLARAYAPEGGVTCAPTDPAAVPGNETQAALGGPASATVPLALTGAGALLLGVVLIVAAGKVLPRRATPSPRAR